MESITINGVTSTGHTIKEICRMLGIPYSMYHNARNKKKNKLDALEHCVKRRNLALLRERYRPEYDRFLSMKNRTTNKNDRDYKRLYHRVGFYDGWLGEFGFLDFIYSVGPMPDHTKINGRNKWTIDRIDNNRGYQPGNCRWATMKEQCRNKSDNKYITIDGKRYVQSEACEMYGMSQQVFWNRVNVCHWSVEKALTTPIREREGDNK